MVTLILFSESDDRRDKPAGQGFFQNLSEYWSYTFSDLLNKIGIDGS